MTVGDLLQQARDAHLRYRAACPRRVPRGETTVAVPGHEGEAGAALREACRARLEARALDPDRTDPAWREDVVDTDTLLDFYGEQLSR